MNDYYEVTVVRVVVTTSPDHQIRPLEKRDTILNQKLEQIDMASVVRALNPPTIPNKQNENETH